LRRRDPGVFEDRRDDPLLVRPLRRPPVAARLAPPPPAPRRRDPRPGQQRTQIAAASPAALFEQAEDRPHLLDLLDHRPALPHPRPDSPIPLLARPPYLLDRRAHRGSAV